MGIIVMSQSLLAECKFEFEEEQWQRRIGWLGGRWSLGWVLTNWVDGKGWGNVSDERGCAGEEEKKL